MIRAVLFMVKVGLLVAAAVWVAERPGSISVEWLDYTFTIHVGLFLILLLVTMVLGMFLFRFLKTIADSPKTFSRYKQRRRREKGYRALTLGLTAVAAGDTKSAAYQAYRAGKFLPGDTGLPLLLKAQAARLEGREEEARESFAALLENKDAAFLGVRGLLQAALDLQNHPKALELAREALKLHPKQPWILRVVYDLEIKMKDWSAARKTLYRVEKSGALPAEKANSDRVAMLLAEADLDLENGFREEAFQKLKKAHKYDPLFIPAVQRLAKLYIQRRARRRAVTIIEKAWKGCPHPELVPLWDLAMPENKSGDPMVRLKWFERLLALNTESAEGQMAVARAAMDDGLWGEARSYLKMAERIKPSVRLYKMLAELEEREARNEEAVKKWLEKAAEAPQDKQWICRETGRTYSEWMPVAQPHGSFNTIVWDYPQAAMQDHILPSDETALLITPPA